MAATGKGAWPKLLTAAEIGGYLKIDLSTVYRLAKAGQLPHFRVGTELRFNRDTIDAWRLGPTERVAVTPAAAINPVQPTPEQRSAEMKRRAAKRKKPR